MQKTPELFDQRSKKKKKLEFDAARSQRVFFPKPREIRRAYQGINLGREQSGQRDFLRPVLIVSRVGSLYFSVPLTTKAKANDFEFPLQNVAGLKRSSVVLLTHAKSIDRIRLVERMGFVDENEFLEITKTLSKFYFG